MHSDRQQSNQLTPKQWAEGSIRVGNTYNLNEIDFDGHFAYVISRQDGLMVIDCIHNIRNLDFDKLADDPFIIIGEGQVSLADNTILVPGAVILTPKQLRNIFLATNYHPKDCFRASYTEILALAPEERKNVVLLSKGISEVYNLGNDPVKIMYVETNMDGLLKSVLASPELKKRLLCCSEAAATTFNENIFSVFRNPSLHHTSNEFLYTTVMQGDRDHTLPCRRWTDLLNDSELITSIDVCRKYGIKPETLDSLLKIQEKTPELTEDINIAIQNELEILKANLQSFIPGAYKGSVIEQPDIGAGYGYYRFLVVHSHPLIDENGNIEPSQADLTELLRLELMRGFHSPEAYSPSECLVHSPIFIIVQPASVNGKSFYGLIIRSEDTLTIERDITAIPDDDTLMHSYLAEGVATTLEKLGFKSTKFKFSNGRYSPNLDKIISTL